MYPSQVLKKINNDDSMTLDAIARLLDSQGLKFEKTVDFVFGLYEDEKLIGTGSLYKNIIKMVALESDYQGASAINTLMSGLIEYGFQLGIMHLFIYTTPDKIFAFQQFGFYRIESTDQVALLENRSHGLSHYIASLQDSENMPEAAAVIVNCNPFTLGHRHLIRHAALENEKLYVFVLWEDASVFSSEVRFRLIQEGTKDLDNVVLLWAKDYIISAATFPSYFIRDQQQVVEVQTELDAKIFGEHIAKALNIKRRYIGEEPFNQVTDAYNKALKRVLPRYGVEVLEIPRLKSHEEPISASRVRRYLAEDKWDQIEKIVPESTLKYLKSSEALGTINKLKRSDYASKLV